MRSRYQEFDLFNDFVVCHRRRRLGEGVHETLPQIAALTNPWIKRHGSQERQPKFATERLCPAGRGVKYVRSTMAGRAHEPSHVFHHTEDVHSGLTAEGYLFPYILEGHLLRCRH